MNSILSKHFDKDNLHHAYLIEGKREEVLPEIEKFMKSLGVKTTGSPDFNHISVDSFKIDDARNLRSYGTEKVFSPENKKVFVISANSFLLEAQNSLLKMFEEPIENMHFFVIVPDVNSLLKTLVSRFYLIKPGTESDSELKDAEKFVSMPLRNRIEFVKELLVAPDDTDDEGNKITVQDSARSKALVFLDALEVVLHDKVFKNAPYHSTDFFNHIFKVREFIRMPGSSTKSLMESVAIIIPNF